MTNPVQQVQYDGVQHLIQTCNEKQYLLGTETTIFGVKVVREYLGEDGEGNAKKGSVIVLEGAFDEKLQNGLGAINKKARGYWLAIPAITTFVIGALEFIAAFAVVGHAAGIWLFCDLEESSRHGDVKLQMKIGGILLKNGLINMVSGAFETLPFIGPEVARYVGKKQGWVIEKEPRTLQPKEMSFLDMMVERTVIKEETKQGDEVIKTELKKGPIEIRQSSGGRYESIKKFLVSGTERRLDGKQSFSGAKGWWLMVPGALTAILGLGQMFIGVGKMLYPIGVLAFCGITKIDSRNHSECALHVKLGVMLFKRGVGDLILGLRLMVPKHGARTARALERTNKASGLWTETEKTIIRGQMAEPELQRSPFATESPKSKLSKLITENKQVDSKKSEVSPGSELVKSFDKNGTFVRYETQEKSKQKQIRPEKIFQKAWNSARGKGPHSNRRLAEMEAEASKDAISVKHPVPGFYSWEMPSDTETSSITDERYEGADSPPLNQDETRFMDELVL